MISILVKSLVQTESIQALQLSFHLNTHRKEANRKWLISSFPCLFLTNMGFFPIFKRAISMVNGQQRPFSVLMVSLKNWGKKKCSTMLTYLPTFTVNVYYIQLGKVFSEVAILFIFFYTLILRDLSLIFLSSWNFVQGFSNILFYNTVSSNQNTWKASYEAFYEVLYEGSTE